MVKTIPKPWGYSSYSGYDVDYEKFVKHAFENPFIQAPFKEFLTDLKSLEFGVYKGESLSDSQSAKYVMKSLKRPNKELSFKVFIEAITTYIVFGGRCLIYKNKGIYNDDLYVYNPDSFTVKRNEDTMLIDEIMLGNTTISGKRLESYNIIKTFNPSDAVAGFGDGYSSIKPLAMVGDMLNYLMKHNNNLLKNSGNANGILWLNGNVRKEDAEKIQNDLNSNLNGSKNVGRVSVVQGIENGRFEKTSTNPKDLDWIEGMKELQKVVCRVMGIPEALIISDNSSYNNLEGFKKKVYEDTIIPFAEFLSDELTSVFEDSLSEDEYIYFSTSKIKALQQDKSKQIKEYAEALQGKISINDFINFVNFNLGTGLPLLDKSMGDKVLVGTNMMFLNDLGVQYEPATQENTGQ